MIPEWNYDIAAAPTDREIMLLYATRRMNDDGEATDVQVGWWREAPSRWVRGHWTPESMEFAHLLEDSEEIPDTEPTAWFDIPPPPPVPGQHTG